MYTFGFLEDFFTKHDILNTFFVIFLAKLLNVP